VKTTKIAILFLFVCAAIPAAAAEAGGQPAGVVNINTANLEELQLLPRVGPALAGRIVEFRKANGPFRSVDELLAVKGIGESSFEKLEPYLVISGATTLTEKVKLPRSKGRGEAAGG
jgi:competence protein ComEA